MWYKETTERILGEIKEVLGRVDPSEVEKLARMIMSADAIFITGVGRVKMSLEAFAKRLAHLGYKVYMVGDVTEPAIGPTDILIVGSGSGESIIPVALADKAVSLGAKVVYIGANRQSRVATAASHVVRIPTNTKLELPGEYKSFQPMTSLFEQALYILGDLVVQYIIQQRGWQLKFLMEGNHANLE